MKKILLTLLLLLSCSACSTELPFDLPFELPIELPFELPFEVPFIAQAQTNNHIEELDDKFTYEVTISRRNYLEAEYSYLNRMDVVNIVEEDDRYYYFKDNNLLLAIDKRYLRDPSAEMIEGFEGYTRNGSSMYANLNVNVEEPIYKFSKNDKVNVIDEIEDMYYIEYQGTYGFIYKSQVSKTRYSTYVAPKVEETPTPSSSGGGGGGGGSSAPAPSSGDGQDISLAYIGSSRTVLLNNELNMEMVVLIYNCPAYISIYDRLDEIRYIGVNEDSIQVLVNGYVGTVKIADTTLASDEYEAWDGYTYGGTAVYYDYYLENEMTKNAKNDKVRVIDKVGKVYVVELEDGMIGYMHVDDISEKKIVTYVAPVVEEVVPTPSYSGGGGGGSPSVWTPPLM